MNISVSIPNSFQPIIKSFNKNYDDFVLEAITEKIEREKNASFEALLKEGYLNSNQENKSVFKDFEHSDFENI